MAEEQKHKVTVVVGPRPMGRLFAAKREWPVGQTETEVTEEELLALARRTDLAVFEGGKRLKVEEGDSSTFQALLPDEMNVLAEYRQKKAKDPKAAAPYQAAKVVSTDEQQPDPKQPPGPPLRSTGSYVRQDAAEPLADREVLQGEKPDEVLKAKRK